MHKLTVESDFVSMRKKRTSKDWNGRKPLHWLKRFLCAHQTKIIMIINQSYMNIF